MNQYDLHSAFIYSPTTNINSPCCNSCQISNPAIKPPMTSQFVKACLCTACMKVLDTKGENGIGGHVDQSIPEVALIAVIERQLQSIITKGGSLPQGFDYTTIRHLIDSYPDTLVSANDKCQHDLALLRELRMKTNHRPLAYELKYPNQALLKQALEKLGLKPGHYSQQDLQDKMYPTALLTHQEKEALGGVSQESPSTVDKHEVLAKIWKEQGKRREDMAGRVNDAKYSQKNHIGDGNFAVQIGKGRDMAGRVNDAKYSQKNHIRDGNFAVQIGKGRDILTSRSYELNTKPELGFLLWFLVTAVVGIVIIFIGERSYVD